MPNKILANAGAITANSNINAAATQPETINNSEIANAIPSSDATSVKNVVKTEEGTDDIPDLFYYVAKLCKMQYREGINFNDNIQRKIACFLVDKTIMSDDGIIDFIYGQNINKIDIHQSMSDYGTTATIEVEDISGALTMALELQNNFYCVVGIFDIINQSENDKGVRLQDGYMYQPYIFGIENATVISPEGTPSKTYQIKLRDIISHTLKSISYGNLLLEYPSFINSNNFAELYDCLLNYAAKIIQLNHNNNFKINTDIFYIDDITDNVNDIIRYIVLDGLPITLTCYDLLNHIFKHAAREVKPPENFNGEAVGNILIPMTLHDEFEDISGMYKTYFKRDQTKNVTEKISFTTPDGMFSTSGHYIKRGFYAKCILKPFELAFNNKVDNVLIYENINPARDSDDNLLPEEKLFFASNGLVFSQIKNNIELPPDNSVVEITFKNLAILSDNLNGNNNILVYFKWIYEYYKAAFLNGQDSLLYKKLEKNINPNITPHFHILESNLESDIDNELFARLNSNTIIAKSPNTILEALYYVGRVIKTYIFMNNLFGFDIKGNIFRHPGEIIKINVSGDTEDESITGTIGGLEAKSNKFVLAYTTSITHRLNGSTIEDLIYANKICSIN